MECVITKAKLVDLAESAASCAAPKSPQQVLKMARIELAGTELRVLGTDLARTIEARADCDARQMGATLVDAKRLLECAKGMPSAPVHLTLDAKGLTIKSGPRKFKIETMNVADFPAVDAWPVNAKTWTVPSATIKRLVNRVRHSISSDVTSPQLNCLVIEPHTFKRAGKPTGETGIRVDSTDRHRLSVVHSTDAWGGPQVLVPEPAVGLLLALAERGDALEFACAGSGMFIRCGDRSARITTYEATHPPVDQMVGLKGEYSMTVDRASMRDAMGAVVRASSAVSGRVDLTFAPGKITLASESNDTASNGIDGQDEVDCEAPKPCTKCAGAGCETCAGAIPGPTKAHEVSLNGRYLIDILDSFDCERIVIEAGHSMDPVILRDPDVLDDLSLTMPQRRN